MFAIIEAAGWPIWFIIIASIVALAIIGERFYSLRHHTAKRKGTGLGLTLVRETAELHGGTITLEPAEGGGTVARLTLPLG